MAFDLNFLEAQLLAAGLPITGLSFEPAIVPKSVPVTWYAKDGGFVRLGWTSTPTAPQDASAASIVAAFDTSPAAEAARLTADQRTQSVALLSDPRPEMKAYRSLLSSLLDELNLIRAALPHPITSITRSGTTATATTPTAHGLSAGNTLAIHGAAVAAYNGAKTVVTTPTATTLTFTVAGSPATPAAGSLFYAMGAVPPTPPRTMLQVRAVISGKAGVGGADIDN